MSSTGQQIITSTLYDQSSLFHFEYTIYEKKKPAETRCEQKSGDKTCFPNATILKVEHIVREKFAQNCLKVLK